MSKAHKKISNEAISNVSDSTGSRGDSALGRNHSGNHYGNRRGVSRTPSSGKMSKDQRNHKE